MLVKFHCTVSSLSCVVLWSCFSFFSIIKRLDQYDEFFPAFQSLVSELKRLLSECLCIHSYCVLYWDIAIAVIKCGSCVSKSSLLHTEHHLSDWSSHSLQAKHTNLHLPWSSQYHTIILMLLLCILVFYVILQ